MPLFFFSNTTKTTAVILLAIVRDLVHVVRSRMWRTAAVVQSIWGQHQKAANGIELIHAATHPCNLQRLHTVNGTLAAVWNQEF